MLKKAKIGNSQIELSDENKLFILSSLSYRYTYSLHILQNQIIFKTYILLGHEFLASLELFMMSGFLHLSSSFILPIYLLSSTPTEAFIGADTVNDFVN